MAEGPDDRIPGDLATRGTPIGARVAGLGAAVEAARGRVADAVLDDVATGVDRSTGRLRLSARHTVVAIAGATGSGKSSTYNALTGLELSSVGIRRPTTSWATAVVWGSEGAGELLDWLGIPPRHQTMRDSMLDTRSESEFDGVVLLDLPDHDSTEVAHHLEVDRLVAVADLMVWILDPQKYADAAVHDRYFKPMGTHQGVMLVALNHIDTVPPERRQAMIDDVRRLLAEDGLPQVQVLPISAKEGIGMAELRAEILRRVNDKRSTSLRVEADIAAAAGRLEQAGGTVPATELSARRVEEVEDRLADAAGISAVVEGIERTVGERARAARSRGRPSHCWGVARTGPGPTPRSRRSTGPPSTRPCGRSPTRPPTASARPGRHGSATSRRPGWPRPASGSSRACAASTSAVDCLPGSAWSGCSTGCSCSPPSAGSPGGPWRPSKAPPRT
ncbi:GTPase [Nocardioides sp. L-11A]|uniref:GTPase n=1 Tax=Nocardioides sp. L-11A TaxID=3043848 RepID=UPI00249C43A2|nr:50S ribosome-binding GTPase [Nocardioides sp. L-11A]